ncbi:MAG: DNA polymerase beta domain-containing protein [Parcubacteria group bacterium Gr01-1014_17]|nr:MAG: DNA polymerase beta domain-containing protein [Parcubacteria group bacterium Gr01-1014_17]
MNEMDKKKIADIMEKHDIIVGYLFGSAARGQMGYNSDIDVAVLFDENKVPREKQYDKKLAISHEIAQGFSVRDADVINLNETTNPVLRYEAVLEGEVIFVKDSTARARLACAVLHEYEDTRYLRETSYRILREQIKSGAFGRVPIRSQTYVAA